MKGRSGATATSEPTFARAPGALARRTPVSRVVSVDATSSPLRIEGGAAALWDALAAPMTRAELVAYAGRLADRPPAELADEVERALGVLVASGAVVQT